MKKGIGCLCMMEPMCPQCRLRRGVLKMNMENQRGPVALRVTAAPRTADGTAKRCTMHFCAADEGQQSGEYFPIAKGRKKIAQEKREPVFSAMSGGTVGYCLKHVFALYFIDSRLLQYLGYAKAFRLF